MADQDFSYSKSIAKYNEISDKQLEKQPHAPGYIYITESGRIVFDSPYYGNRVEITGPKVISTAIDFNSLIYTMKYSVEVTTCTNRPEAIVGLLEVNRGSTRIYQRYTTSNGVVYVRSGTIATDSSVSWTTWTNV